MIQVPDRLVGQETRSQGHGRHVRTVVLDGLERPDRPSELDAHGHIFDGRVQRLLGVPNALDGGQGAKQTREEFDSI